MMSEQMVRSRRHSDRRWRGPSPSRRAAAASSARPSTWSPIGAKVQLEEELPVGSNAGLRFRPPRGHRRSTSTPSCGGRISTAPRLLRQRRRRSVTNGRAEPSRRPARRSPSHPVHCRRVSPWAQKRGSRSSAMTLQPPPKPGGNYVPGVRVGNVLYLFGHGPAGGRQARRGGQGRQGPVARGRRKKVARGVGIDLLRVY